MRWTTNRYDNDFERSKFEIKIGKQYMLQTIDNSVGEIYVIGTQIILSRRHWKHLKKDNMLCLF